MLTATAAVAATPQTPVTSTQQPVKKAEPAKEHHATKGNMKAHSATHATKVKEEKATAKPEATKEQPKEATKEAPKAEKKVEYKK